MVDRYSYRLLNLAFAVAILAVFLYCLLAVPRGGVRLECIHVRLLGHSCASCGLTRAFARLLHADLVGALALNPVSVKVFCFFSVQLLLRVLALVWSCRWSLKRYVLADVVLSCLFFMYSFKELVLQTFFMVLKLN